MSVIQSWLLGTFTLNFERFRGMFCFSKFQSKRSIRFRFKPDSLENGIMFYAAEHEQGYGDFMAVLLNNGFVEIRYSVAGSTLRL